MYVQHTEADYDQLTPPGPSQEQGSLAPAGGLCSGCQPELCGVVCGFSSVGLRVKLGFREVGGGGKGCRLGTNIATPRGPAFEKAAGNKQGLSWRMRQAPQDQAQPATAGHNRGPAHSSLHPNSDTSWVTTLPSSRLLSAAEVRVRSVKPSFKGAKSMGSLHSTVLVSGSGL